MRTRVATALLLGALACGCAEGPGTSRPERPAPRLVLLYATCTLNKDFLSPYREEVRFTPHVQAFADEGVLFRRHVTEAGVSGIAYASLLAGAQADRHGAYNHPKILSEQLHLLPEAFADAGYDTFFWNCHPMTAPELNYAQGVADDHIVPPGGPKGNLKPVVRNMLHGGDEAFQGILDRLKSDPEYRALVIVDFTVTHAAYTRQVHRGNVRDFIEANPEFGPVLPVKRHQRLVQLYEDYRLPLQWNFPFESERLNFEPKDVEELAGTLEATYAATVALLDSLFGRTVETLRAEGLLDQSLVALTADHGEVLYRDNALFQWTHGLQLAAEELTVPWILRGPGLSPGAYEGVTRSIDVYPTLAGLCGVELGRGTQVTGTDLAPALLGEAPPPELLSFSHTKVLGDVLLEEFRPWEHVSRFYPRSDPELMWTSVRGRGPVPPAPERGRRDLDHGGLRPRRRPRAAGRRLRSGERAPPRARGAARDLQGRARRRLRSGHGRGRAVQSEIEEKLRALGYIR